MSDTIDAVIADLAAAGAAGQVQWADAQTSWDEGTIVCRRDGDAVVVTQLWRHEGGDHVQRFVSEAEAAAHLRRRLLGTRTRRLTATEREAMLERTRRHTERTRARLESERRSP